VPDKSGTPIERRNRPQSLRSFHTITRWPMYLVGSPFDRELVDFLHGSASDHERRPIRRHAMAWNRASIEFPEITIISGLPPSRLIRYSAGLSSTKSGAFICPSA
jgi:hypothetical protein